MALVLYNYVIFTLADVSFPEFVRYLEYPITCA